MKSPEVNTVATVAVEAAAKAPTAIDQYGPYGFLGFLLALAALYIRRVASSNRGVDAVVKHTEANTNATSLLYGHLEAQLASTTAAIGHLSERVAILEVALRETKLMYRASAAGERRYRDAFGELIQEHARMMELVRTDPPRDVLLTELFGVDRRVTTLISNLSKPINLGDDEDELRPE